MEIIDTALRLGRVAKAVDISDENLPALLGEMLRVMKDRRGIGLAATQVGLDMNMAIIQLPEKKLIQLINPKILSMSRPKLSTEGCLSLPRTARYVLHRYNNVLATYQGLDGKNKFIEARGLLAFAIQHEVDHLRGIVIDRKTLK